MCAIGLAMACPITFKTFAFEIFILGNVFVSNLALFYWHPFPIPKLQLEKIIPHLEFGRFESIVGFHRIEAGSLGSMDCKHDQIFELVELDRAHRYIFLILKFLLELFGADID